MKRILPILLVLSLIMSMPSYGKANSKESQMEKELYTVVKTGNKPDWSNVPVLQIDKVLWTEDFGIRAQGQLCYCSATLYTDRPTASGLDPVAVTLIDTGAWMVFELLFVTGAVSHWTHSG